ncbi:MAG: hypothetical protein ABJP45_13965 [Cyclobacteriaceae bacterium]
MKRILLYIVSASVLIRCGSDDASNPEPGLAAPTSLSVRDVSNAGNGTDFQLTFLKPQLVELVTEFRIFVVKSGSVSSFDSVAALQVAANAYTSINAEASATEISFDSNLADIDGDKIVEDVDYNFYVLALGVDDEGAFLSNPSTTVKLEQRSAVKTLTDFIDSGSGGMDADKNGNIYMGDFGVTLSGGGKRVFLITPEGEVSVFANGMNGASGNDFDTEGNLFQSNITGGTISKITPEGQVSTFVSGISSPIGIAINDQGTAFVAACNNLIWKITSDGTAEIFSSSGLLSCPNGIELDDKGNVYTCNFDDGRVIKITPSGEASVFATIPGNNNGHLLRKGDTFYIAARGANQIYKISMSGRATRFAGSGSRGLGNGSLSEATFSLPNDLAFSPDGTKLYVNDKDPRATGSTISPVVIRVIDLVDE